MRCEQWWQCAVLRVHCGVCMCTYVQCTCVHGCVYLHVCVCVDVMYVRTYVVQSHSSKHQKEMALLHAIRMYVCWRIGCAHILKCCCACFLQQSDERVQQLSLKVDDVSLQLVRTTHTHTHTDTHTHTHTDTHTHTHTDTHTHTHTDTRTPRGLTVACTAG